MESLFLKLQMVLKQVLRTDRTQPQNNLLSCGVYFFVGWLFYCLSQFVRLTDTKAWREIKKIKLYIL